MQIINAKASFGCVPRMHPQTQEEVSAATVLKSQVAEIVRASADLDAEIFFDESLSPITRVDLIALCSLALELAEGPLRGGFMLRSFRLSVVSLTILAFLPFFASAQRPPFAVGTASAAPGQKATGTSKSPPASMPEQTFLWSW
jgi:hypothetical protein